MIKPKLPPPIAYCKHHGREMTKRDLTKHRCMDPTRIAEGRCKHLIKYGSNNIVGARLTMQDLYETIIKTLEEHGVRLEGTKLCLVQEMPDGGKMRLFFDQAERNRTVELPCRER